MKVRVFIPIFVSRLSKYESVIYISMLLPSKWKRPDGDRVVSIGPEERIVQEAATKPKEWIVYKRKGKK